VLHEQMKGKFADVDDLTLASGNRSLQSGGAPMTGP